VQSINTAQVRATPVSCTSSKTIDRQTEAEMRIGLHVETLIQDIRFSFRWLVRERAFTATGPQRETCLGFELTWFWPTY
jgi:hypothetical protein